MPSNIDALSGTYKKEGAHLTQEGTHLVLCHRKNPGNKPPSYLLSKQGKGYRYISSLYATASDGVYTFDYAGADYRMKVQDDTAVISKGGAGPIAHTTISVQL